MGDVIGYKGLKEILTAEKTKDILEVAYQSYDVHEILMACRGEQWQRLRQSFEYMKLCYVCSGDV